MYKMPARRVPLIWKTQKESDQQLFKYNHATQRVVQVGCGCPCIGLPVGDFTLLSWEIVGVESFSLQAFWSPSPNALSYTFNLLLSDTYPVTSSNVYLSFPNVQSGDLIPISESVDSAIRCKFFGVQIVAIGKCDSKSSNIISDQYLTLQKSVAPATSSLTFGVSDLTISFPDGINANSYEVTLYDVTTSSYPLYNPILSGISTNTSPFVIPYTSLIPFGVSTPVLVTGHQYQLIIVVSNTPSGGQCTDSKTYPPVVFDQVFPTTTFQYIRVGGGIGDPGSGNFSTVITTPPNVVLQFSTTDKNSQDATTFLSTQLASATTITITKDISNYSNFTRNSQSNFGSFWAFNCTIASFSGFVALGDTATITYS
jgi:hypothetical protein